jgi:nitroreductase
VARPPGIDGDVYQAAQALITTRQNVSAKRLDDPGPSGAECDALLNLAAAAPDHGQLTPWRFVTIPAQLRHLLAEVFALALLDRDPDATPEQVQAARDKAHRAPLLLVAVARLGPREPDTPALERLVSLGAAIQNMLLGAHAMGYGTGLTSGQAMRSPRLHALLDLAVGDHPVCCINIGTVRSHKPAGRVRPAPSAFSSTLAQAAPPPGIPNARSPTLRPCE